MAVLSEDIVNKIPSDLHHITVEGLLPLLSVLMAHAQGIESMSGPDRKQLVLSCLDILVARMPFPENKVIGALVDAVAPQAIEGIVQAGRMAEHHLTELTVSPRLDRFANVRPVEFARKISFGRRAAVSKPQPTQPPQGHEG